MNLECSISGASTLGVSVLRPSTCLDHAATNSLLSNYFAGFIQGLFSRSDEGESTNSDKANPR